MKSPDLNEAKKMLGRLAYDAKQKFDKETEEHKISAEIWGIQKKEADKKLTAAITEALKNGGDARAAAKAIDLPPEPVPPVYRRYETNDPTVEKLGELMNQTPRGLLVYRDELVGLLHTMDRAGHEGDRAFYLEGWVGNQRFTYDRIGRGTLEIDAVCLSLLGGIQPGPLQEYISQAAGGGAGDDGMLQRMQLLVWPDVSSKWENHDHYPSTEAKTAVYEIYKRLDAITPNITRDVPGLRFDEAGQQSFDAWRAKLEHRLRNEDMPDEFASHLGKYRSLMPSLALLFHLIDTPNAGAVGAQHAARAIAWCEYLESHARRLYAQRLNPAMAAAIRLSKRLKDLPEVFTARDVYRKGWQGLDSDAVGLALPVLVEFGHLIRREGEKTPDGGRKAARYLKNPGQNLSDTPKDGTDKTDKTYPDASSVSFVSSPYEGNQNFGADEVEL
jgi:putative DNA primase/helicase